MRRLLTLLTQQLLLATVTVTVTAAETMQVAWTRDERYQGNTGAYGPDGPWQALAVRVGNSSSSSFFFDGAYAPMWPSGGGVSMVLTREAGGNYSTADSSTARITGTLMGGSDDWMGYRAQNESSWGVGVFDIVTLGNKMVASEMVHANTTVAAEDWWVYYLPDGTNYTASVGILGMGLPVVLGDGPFRPPLSILHSLKAEERIASATFGLHMGSVAFEQRGSLVLGGYEQNRALGTMGVFNLEPRSLPYMFLVDAQIGTEVGGSPFNRTTNNTKPEGGNGGAISIWRGTGDSTSAKELNNRLGAKPNTAVVIPNPAVPYIYLPPGTCEAAASILPVTLDDRLGLYLWNTSSPLYSQIINSPTYMSFIFSDRTATNITVKVPFHLLNLTLEAPLVEEATSYFPCKPLESEYEGFWMLGRAFLQAAFLGVDLERNLTYIAQAPGPGMEQSVVRTVFAPESGGKDGGLETNPIAEWESSWRGSWTVLEEGEGGDGGGLGTGAVVGIVVGVVSALVMVGIVGVWFFRRRKARLAAAEPSSGNGVSGGEEWAKSPDEQAEMDGHDKLAEMGVDRAAAHEMESPCVRHEAPEDVRRTYAELPAENVPVRGGKLVKEEGAGDVLKSNGE